MSSFTNFLSPEHLLDIGGEFPAIPSLSDGADLFTGHSLSDDKGNT
jgi:hypothetical protein